MERARFERATCPLPRSRPLSPSTPCPGDRGGRVALDEPTLIGTHLGQLVGREATELLDLAREDGRAAGHAVREHDLDTLPAVSGHDLEDRPHLDDEAGLLAYLARKCVLDSLAGF